MGVLRWLRGGDESGPGSALGVGGLGELDALTPGKDRQLENLQTLDALRDEAGDGSTWRREALDLNSGVAVVRVRRDVPAG